MWGLFATIIFGIMIFFFQDIIKFFMKRLKPSSKKIIWYATFVMLASCISGLIGSLCEESVYKLALCFGSFGIICLGTLLILSLLFIATIPEDMEKEDEQG